MTSDHQERFGEALLERLTATPFGSLSKSELELAIFTALVSAGMVDVATPTFALAQKLECMPTRVNTLVYNWRLRSSAGSAADLANAVGVAGLERGKDKSPDRIILNVEDRFHRETLIARLKEVHVYSDTSFNRERVVLSLKAFEDNIGPLFGGSKADLEAALKREKKGARFDRWTGLLQKASTTAATRAVGAGAAFATTTAMHTPLVQDLIATLTI